MTRALRDLIAFLAAIGLIVAPFWLAARALDAEQTACLARADDAGLVAHWTVEAGCRLAKHDERIARQP